MLFAYEILSGTKDLKSGTVFGEIQIHLTSFSTQQEYEIFLESEKVEAEGQKNTACIFDNIDDSSQSDKGVILKSYIRDLGKKSDTDLGITPRIDDEISSLSFTIASETAYHNFGSSYDPSKTHEISLFANPNRYFFSMEQD